MRNTSSLYKSLRLRIDKDASYEARVTQGNKVYGMDKLISCVLTVSLTGNGNGIVIGQACSTECDLVLLEQSANWARMAKFALEVRIVSDDGTEQSEWIKIGEFYTDERSEDKYGRLMITAYDGMLLTEQYWTDKIDEEDLPASFPITAKAWCDMVEDAGLVEFDSRTVIDNTVAFIGLDTGSTIRDVLKDIAAVHGGNWSVTEDGKLRLVPYASMEDGSAAIAGLAIAGITIVGDATVNIDTGADYAFLGMSVSSVKTSPPLSAVTGAMLETESGVTASAGTASGYIVTGDCEFSTTTGVAELCLSKVQGYVYKPFEATDAILDPAAEIGDLVIIDGRSYQMMNIIWNINKKPTARIYAPYEEEVDHEYTIPSESAKTYRKSLSATDEKLKGFYTKTETNSLIQQTADAINLSVSTTYVSLTNYQATIADLQQQIDGAVTTYSGGDIPTLNNYPADDWTTDLLKNQHIGSLYLVTSDHGSPMAGQYYRFERNGATYQWALVEDSALATALANAAAAQAAADQAIADAADAREAADNAQGTADEAMLEAAAKAAEAQAAAVLQAALDATNKVNAALEEAKVYAHEELEEFINGEYAEDIDAVKQQLDKKVQTYYQTQDPSLEWDEGEYSEHTGDLWYSMSNQLYYRWNGSSWEEMTANPPQPVFDTLDGKATCFVTQPVPPYTVGDIWTQGSTGDIFRCRTAKATGQSFSMDDWELASKYTDDSTLRAFINGEFREALESIKTQLDGKAETYYQATDPSKNDSGVPRWQTIAGVAVVGASIVGSTYQIHEGDMWYRTTDDKTFRWNGTAWVEEKISREVFDTIDGKANIFITQPVPPYKEADLWVQGETGDIFRCKSGVDKSAGQSYSPYDWELASKYTDDTKAEAVDSDLQAYKETVTSEFQIRDSAIEARVTRTGGQNTSFGWQLTDTYHRWYANNVKVVEITQSGVYVEGEIKATSGYIGNGANGFTITANAIYNGMTSLNDTQHNGIYIGTDGISLGKGAFKVTSSGAVTASNLALTGGSISIGNAFSVSSTGEVTASNLTLTGGSISIGNAFSVSSAGAVTASNLTLTGGSINIGNKFRVDSQGNLTATSGTFEGNVYAKNIQAGGSAGYITGTQIGQGEVDTDNLALQAVHSNNIYPQSVDTPQLAINAVTSDILAGGSVVNGKLGLEAVNAGNIVANSLSDTQMALNQISTQSLTQGIIDSLGYADFSDAVFNNRDVANYFHAVSVKVDRSVTAGDFYIDFGDSEGAVSGHTHFIEESDGVVTIGSPDFSGNSHSFNIADTDFYKDAVSAVKVESLAFYTQSGEQTITFDSTNITLNAMVQATLSNGNTQGSIRTVTIPATLAYNAVTITNTAVSSTPTYQTARKTYSVPVHVTASNGNYSDTTLTVNALDAYNAGFSDGSTSGAGDVSVSTLGLDPDGTISYSGTVNNYYIPIRADLSNGRYRTTTITVSGQDAYDAGVASVTVSTVTASQSTATYETANKRYKVPLSLTGTASNSATKTSSTNIYVSATEAYNAGNTDGQATGVASVTVDTIEFNTAWSYSSTGYRYVSSSNRYQFRIKATASNGATKSVTLSCPADDAYNAGVTTGEATGVDSVTLSSIALDTSWATSSTGYVYQTANNRFQVRVKGTLSNSKTKSFTIYVPAADAYNAGYTAGETAGTSSGAASVTVSSIALNTSWSTSSTGYIYQSAQNRYQVNVKATASNGATKTGNIYVSATAAYNAGVTSGETSGAASVTVTSVTASSSTATYETANKRFKVPLSLTGTASNGATKNSSTNIYVPAGEAYNAGYNDGAATATPRTATSLSRRGGYTQESGGVWAMVDVNYNDGTSTLGLDLWLSGLSTGGGGGGGASGTYNITVNGVFYVADYEYVNVNVGGGGGGGGYSSYTYSTSSAWTSRNGHPVCRVTTIVYGWSGSSSTQLASGTVDYERPY